MGFADGQADRGSSPLARGLRIQDQRRQPADGIIPARAGFTGSRSPPTRAPWDHPRSRGVYESSLDRGDVGPGSSPLARGLHFRGHRPERADRIIPARAGFTEPRHETRRADADHPRSRGVYLCARPRGSRRGGSSPLARGLQAERGCYWHDRRIIPARAGFTRWTARSGQCLPDHPRSRGVYRVPAWMASAAFGSPPLARGLLGLVGGGRQVAGIIPARAGFTSPSAVRARAYADHPRSRGVYATPRPGITIANGSSPLARGLLQFGAGSLGESRIIPARAGFTKTKRTAATTSGDHPRSRGVYLLLLRFRVGAAGSSPLARGLHGYELSHVQQAGIIPARAGFTALPGT